MNKRIGLDGRQRYPGGLEGVLLLDTHMGLTCEVKIADAQVALTGHCFPFLSFLNFQSYFKIYYDFYQSNLK